MFDFVQGVIRWHNRVAAYAVVLVSDQYPRSVCRLKSPVTTPRVPDDPDDRFGGDVALESDDT